VIAKWLGTFQTSRKHRGKGTGTIQRALSNGQVAIFGPGEPGGESPLAERTWLKRTGTRTSHRCDVGQPTAYMSLATGPLERGEGSPGHRCPVGQGAGPLFLPAAINGAASSVRPAGRAALLHARSRRWRAMAAGRVWLVGDRYDPSAPPRRPRPRPLPDRLRRAWRRTVVCHGTGSRPGAAGA
jgi:hypothetical protein